MGRSPPETARNQKPIQKRDVLTERQMNQQRDSKPNSNLNSSRTPAKNRSSNWSPASSTALLAPLQPPNQVNRSKPIFSATRKLNNPNADLDSDILIQTTDIEEHKKELSTKRKTPLKKASTRKPKPGPKITPKPTRKLEPESQEILEAPSKENKDPDFDPNVAAESKAPVRRSKRGATRASSKAAGLSPFTPRVCLGDRVKHPGPVASTKRKAEVPVKTPNMSSRKLQKRSVSPYDCSDEDEIHCRIELSEKEGSQQPIPEPQTKQRKSKEKKRSYSIGKPEVSKSKSEVNEPEMPKDKSEKTSKLTRPKLPSDFPLNDVSNNDSVTKAPKRIQNNGKSIKPNSVDIEMEVNPSEPTYADRPTKSFGSENAVFTESICKKVGSENMSLDQLQTTLRNIQAEFGETNQLMPIQLNIYLGKDIVDAQINRLEEFQQFFRNQHVVDKEKIAKIQAALRNATI